MIERSEVSGAREGPIATRLMNARVRQSGEEITIKISIGRPYWIQEGFEAGCPVTFEGLYGKQPDIRGIDPIDSLRNAIKLIDSLLSGAQTEHELLWPDGEPFENPEQGR